MATITDCFNDYVGIKACVQKPPTSGSFVNQLPGINTQFAEAISSQEQINFEGVWQDVKNRAYDRLINDSTRELKQITKNRAAFNRVFYYTENLELTRPLRTINKAARYRGKQIRSGEQKYVSLKVNAVQIFSNEANNVDTKLVVFGTLDGVLLYEQDVTVTPGLNQITVNQEFLLRYNEFEIFVGIDCTNIDTARSNNQNESYYQGAGCSECDYYDEGFYTNSYEYDISQPVIKENSISSSGNGVQIISNVGCSVNRFLCDNIDILKQAWIYLLGHELMVEKLSTYTLSYWATSNLEQSRSLAELFGKQYMDALNTALEDAPKKGTMCFDCSSSQNTVYSTYRMP